MTPELVTWLSSIKDSIGSRVRGDPFWETYLRPAILGYPVSYTFHLAVLVEPYLRFILRGQKTVESRFSVLRIAPYQQVQAGDVILLKKSSGPIVGLCEVGHAWFYRLNPESWLSIRKEFTEELCAQDPDFWQKRQHASFATLMRIRHVLQIEPIHFRKQDRRGWVVLHNRQQTLDLPSDHDDDSIKENVYTVAANPSTVDVNSSLKHTTAQVPLSERGKRTYSQAKTPISLADLKEAVNLLRTNECRNGWWTREIDSKAKRHALRKSHEQLRSLATKRLRTSVGTVYHYRGSKQPFRDGYHTPYSGSILYYAQHALALCCRKCIKDWYGIPGNFNLTDFQIERFADLLMIYIHYRIPELSHSEF